MLKIISTEIPDVKVLIPQKHYDGRGFFCEVYNRRAFFADEDVEFVQDNWAWNSSIGTVRGLHFQAPPYDQAKLVWVPYGVILDVAVDLRKSSPTYGKHVSVELCGDNGKQLFVPRGFAHGYVTRADRTVVIYKVSNYHYPSHDYGLAWNDPALGIDWGFKSRPILSKKDKHHPTLDKLPTYFE